MNRTFRAGLAVVVVCWATGAAAQTAGLEGTWLFADRGGPLRLTFRADYGYEVDWNADGRADIQGIYEFWDGRLIMRDEYPGEATDCVSPGVYTYQTEAGLLKFRLLADDCQPRREALRQVFIRL